MCLFVCSFVVVCFCLQSQNCRLLSSRYSGLILINLGVLLVLSSTPIEWFLLYFSYHFILFCFVLCMIAAFVYWCVWHVLVLVLEVVGDVGVELRTKCD